jgi:alanine racemase
MRDTDAVTAHLNLQAIRHNLAWLHQHLSRTDNQRPFVWTVVKCHAYGHNLASILPALEHADGLAVLGVDDALACQRSGWKKPLLCMRPSFTTSDLQSPELHGLHLVIDNPEQLAQIQRLSRPTPVHLWLRYAGRLNHAGFTGTDFGPVFAELKARHQQGLIAQARPFFHPAQGEDEHQFADEYTLFHSQWGGDTRQECAFNSAALLVKPQWARQALWVRSGILHYGISPLPGKTGEDLGLIPAMTLQASVYSTQWVNAGEAVGYGGTYRANRKTRVGLVRCGYADGYPRHIDTTTTVLIQGKRATVLGTVAMDLMAIDLTDIPNAGAGSKVTLWGPGLPVEHIARHAGTIAADVCCGLTSQVRYVSTDARPA